MEWHDEARKLRSEGATLQSIADRFDVSRQRVDQVVKGVECPVNHRAIGGRERLKKAWNDQTTRDQMIKKISSSQTKRWQKLKNQL